MAKPTCHICLDEIEVSDSVKFTRDGVEVDTCPDCAEELDREFSELDKEED